MKERRRLINSSRYLEYSVFAGSIVGCFQFAGVIEGTGRKYEQRNFEFCFFLLVFLLFLFLRFDFLHQLTFTIAMKLWSCLVDAIFGVSHAVGIIVKKVNAPHEGLGGE
jgi:hypothetical protein